METALGRILIESLPQHVAQPVLLRGWVHRLRTLGKTTFLVLRDCSGLAQCVLQTAKLRGTQLKSEDTVEVHGMVRHDNRARTGIEVHVHSVQVLNPAAQHLPFTASSSLEAVGIDTLIEYRPLALRNPVVGNVFRIQAALIAAFREYLSGRNFTEIITSKLVASGTEGGTNLFEVKYFDPVAYLAQSPQCYKEQGVGGLERVYETGHVYRAEPHASSRHLTEYYSLDVEFGFIDRPEDLIQFERELLTHIFAKLNATLGKMLSAYRSEPLPSMMEVPCWEFSECLELLRTRFHRADLTDDLDPEAERQLCSIAQEKNGIAALFVLGFPLSARPFYTAPRGDAGAASSFDLLLEGVEITTGGQRLHRRNDLEQALIRRGISPEGFSSHLATFDLGMPPHGGFAIGLERLTAQILKLPNIRQAALYPRDRYHLTP